MQGFKLAEAPVNHRPRLKGRSKYSIGNRLWVSLLDMFGVFWLKKRAFHYRIKTKSDFEMAIQRTDVGPPRKENENHINSRSPWDTLKP